MLAEKRNAEAIPEEGGWSFYPSTQRLVSVLVNIIYRIVTGMEGNNANDR